MLRCILNWFLSMGGIIYYSEAPVYCIVDGAVRNFQDENLLFSFAP